MQFRKYFLILYIYTSESCAFQLSYHRGKNPQKNHQPVGRGVPVDPSGTQYWLAAGKAQLSPPPVSGKVCCRPPTSCVAPYNPHVCKRDLNPSACAPFIAFKNHANAVKLSALGMSFKAVPKKPKSTVSVCFFYFINLASRSVWCTVMLLRQVLEKRWNVILVGVVLKQGRPLPTQLSLPRITVLRAESRVALKNRERCRQCCELKSWV